MKTIQYILVCFVVLAFAACADDWENSKGSDIRVTAGILQTRTVFTESDGVTHVTWKAGDAIGIYTPTQENLKYVAAADGSSTSLTADGTRLTAEEGDEIFAYYPYNVNAQNSWFYIGDQSTDQSPTDFDYMYATANLKNDAVELQFHHLFAFLKVTVKRSDLKADNLRPNVTIIGSDILWATYLSIKDNKLQVGTGEENWVSYYLNDKATEDEITFYMAILPQKEGVTLKIGSLYFFGQYYTTDCIYEKVTPAGGLQAGNVYEVAMSKDIELIKTAELEALAAERDALIALYQSTGGENWTNNTNWCTDKPLSKWYGVNVSDNRVTSLSLAYNNLVGDLPDVFDGLQELTTVYLPGNKLTGTLPSSLVTLEKMDYLHLYYNQLSGTLPSEFTKFMDHYYHLDLGNNQLSGKLPESITSHVNWKNLWVSIVQGNYFDLTGVIIPAPDLSVVDLDGNTITSAIFAQNKLTMIYYWATWCGYSKAFMPSVISLYKQFYEKGLEIIGATDGTGYPCDTEEDVRTYIQENGITWINTFDGNRTNRIKALYTGLTPTVYLFNSEGNVVYQTVTGDNYTDVPQFIADYLGEELGDDGVYTSSDYSRDGEVFTIQTATVGQGIDLVFMGDGFVDTDMDAGGTYEQKMKEAVDNFFTYEPYKSFRDRFNCYGVKVVSANADWTESKMNHAINEDWNVARKYAQNAVGDIEYPIRVTVVYNADWTTGRSYTSFDNLGDFVAFVMEPTTASRDVLTHEACGHGFANLLDEYVEDESDTSSPSTAQKNTYDSQWSYYGWGANVDWRNDLTEVRWAKLSPMSATTAKAWVPTKVPPPGPRACTDPPRTV